MKCSVFIATSADGYIATPEGGVEWLEAAGDQSAEPEDMGMAAYMQSVDCMIMGRKCMEKIASFNLTPEQWPYGDTRIIVLSRTLSEPPESLKGKMEIFSGELTDLLAQLEAAGFEHAYIDGGSTITSFLRLKLIDEMTITQAPVLLGKGIPLFGEFGFAIELRSATARAFDNGFVQTHYALHYPK